MLGPKVDRAEKFAGEYHLYVIFSLTVRKPIAYRPARLGQLPTISVSTERHLVAMSGMNDGQPRRRLSWGVVV